MFKQSEQNFDTHNKHFPKMKDMLLPPVDRAFSALLEDLDERGLLDETLVAWTGEFGRTPKINGNGGRDHWGRVYSTVLAGGGMRGGQVIGRSDKQGGAAGGQPRPRLRLLRHDVSRSGLRPRDAGHRPDRPAAVRGSG